MFCRCLSVKTPDIPSDSDQQLVVRVKIVENQDKRLANIVEKGVLGNQDEKKRTCVWAALKSRAGYVVDCALDILLWTMYYNHTLAYESLPRPKGKTPKGKKQFSKVH